MSNEEHKPGPVDLAGLLKCLQETPNTLSALIDELSDSELRWRNSDGEFSALENICHLRDLELQGYTPRINRILNEGDPALADFDGARVAAESDYNDEQSELALQTFQEARSENVQTLKTLTEEQLKRKGTLEGVGQITLRRLAEMMREHDEGHIEGLRRLQRQRQTQQVT